jgi:hypothetical protein
MTRITDKARKGERYSVDFRSWLTSRPYAVVSVPTAPGYTGEGSVVANYADPLTADFAANALNIRAKRLEREV